MSKSKVNPVRIESIYFDKLIADKGLGSLDGKTKAAIKHNLKEEFTEYSERKMIQALSDEKLAELDQKLDAGMSPEELDEFLTTAGVDFKMVMLGALEDFRNDYLGGEIEVSTEVAKADDEGIQYLPDTEETLKKLGVEEVKEVKTEVVAEAPKVVEMSKAPEMPAQIPQLTPVQAQPVASSTQVTATPVVPVVASSTPIQAPAVTSPVSTPTSVPAQGAVSVSQGQSNVEGATQQGLNMQTIPHAAPAQPVAGTETVTGIKTGEEV